MGLSAWRRRSFTSSGLDSSLHQIPSLWEFRDLKHPISSLETLTQVKDFLPLLQVLLPKLPPPPRWTQVRHSTRRAERGFDRSSLEPSILLQEPSQPRPLRLHSGVLLLQCQVHRSQSHRMVNHKHRHQPHSRHTLHTVSRLLPLDSAPDHHHLTHGSVIRPTTSTDTPPLRTLRLRTNHLTVATESITTTLMATG